MSKKFGNNNNSNSSGINVAELVMPGDGPSFVQSAIQQPLPVQQQQQQQYAQQQQAMMMQQQQQLQQQQAYQNSTFLGDPQPTGPTARFGTKAEPEGSFLTRLIWNPMHVTFRIAPYLRSMFWVFAMAIVIATSVSRIASVSNSTVVGLNSFLVGSVYAAGTLFSLSWRNTQGVPIHFHWAIILAEMCHMHLGLIFGIPMMGLLLAGSALSGWWQSVGILNSATVPGVGPSAAIIPMSYWGAMGTDLLLATLVVLAYLHNVPMKSRLVSNTAIAAETYRFSFGLTSTSILTALAVFISTVIGYPSGVYALGNPVVYFGGAITLGFDAPFSGAWTIPILWGLVAGVLGFAIHLFTYNMNGLTHEDFAKMSASETYTQLEENKAMIQALQFFESNAAVANKKND